MSYDYEATIARELGRFFQNGSVIRSKKPIYWCASCMTALAEAEVEYHDHKSPSIYVKFPLTAESQAKFPELVGKAGLRPDLDDDSLDPSGEPCHCAASRFHIRRGRP